jgi:hypothetical protein
MDARAQFVFLTLVSVCLSMPLHSQVGSYAAEYQSNGNVMLSRH